VTGSGPGGRVVKRDLEASASRALAPAAAPAVVESHPASPIPHPAPSGAPFQDVPLTQIRKTIAKRLATSLGPIPHFFLTTEVDMERAAEARDALNRQLGDRGKVSFNDVIVKATALALTKHRACNAWFQDDHIRYWTEVHIGVAVAVEDGLITPVIRNADLKPLLEIGREARELAEKARSRRLQPSEYTGATFSVSNLGMFEIDQFTAVINPPEAGIIAVGSAQLGMTTAVVERDKLGGVCVNIGCIPTKALLHSAYIAKLLREAKEFGVEAGSVKTDYGVAMQRSRRVSDQNSKGVEFLMKKNKVTVVKGSGVLQPGRKVKVGSDVYEAKKAV